MVSPVVVCCDRDLQRGTAGFVGRPYARVHSCLEAELADEVAAHFRASSLLAFLNEFSTSDVRELKALSCVQRGSRSALVHEIGRDWTPLCASGAYFGECLLSI